ncbi:MAG: glycoside hydrolase family 2 TIM barrel-domain containing protein [Planctomycetia bacterium]|jgi:beta-galactosidase
MQKKLAISAVLIACLYSFILHDLAHAQTRIKEDISKNWRFIRSDEAGADSRDFEEVTRAEKKKNKKSKWKTVNLPHTWNTKDIFDDVPGYHRGIGWYRKEVAIPKSWAGKRIVVRFEAACIVAKVWVNGKLLGQHKGSWTPFEFDITDLVTPGTKDNLIAVQVDNRMRRDVMPHHIDFNFMGGLHREVYLIATDPTYIESVRVTTPQVSEKLAQVEVKTKIRNESSQKKSYAVVNTITGPGLDKPLVATSRQLGIAPGQTVTVGSTRPVANPKLWSPDEPNLYKVTTQLLVDGKPVDEVKNPLGFRWFRFDPNEGFFLNGKHLKLKGVNRHDDYPGLGWALPVERQIKDVELIKGLGANFLRTAHYTQHPVVLETCDKLGILVWEELPFDGEGFVSPILGAKDMAVNLRKVLHEMIERDANHPAIVIWSLGNENMQSPSGAGRKAVANLTKELDKLCNELDPTRPTGVAINKPYRSKPAGLNDAVDILGYNIYDGWYKREIEDFAKNVEKFHKENPTKPIVITEYGAGVEKGLHREEPKRQDYSEEHGCTFHEFYWNHVKNTPYIAGSLQWNVFDFAAEHRDGTIPRLNQKGIFTYDRQPKDVYYFYKSSWSDDPTIYIVSHTWTERTPGVKQIPVYSNAETVELFHNGKSLGKKKVKNSKAVWDVDIKAGKNQLRAVGLKDGKEIVDAMTVTGK